MAARAVVLHPEQFCVVVIPPALLRLEGNCCCHCDRSIQRAGCEARTSGSVAYAAERAKPRDQFATRSVSRSLPDVRAPSGVPRSGRGARQRLPPFRSHRVYAGHSMKRDQSAVAESCRPRAGDPDGHGAARRHPRSSPRSVSRKWRKHGLPSTTSYTNECTRSRLIDLPREAPRSIGRPASISAT